MQLRDKPLKLAAMVACGTIVSLFGGLDLFDGAISIRRLGDLSATTTPVHFWTFVSAFALGCCFLVLGWFVVWAEWKIDYTPPPKQRFDDPERRQ